MRLINTESLGIYQFFGSNLLPKYAILSHTWNENEVNYEEFINGSNHDGAGFQKIREFCQIARSEGCQYGWIDTCCIDKRNSAELSEAINSMYTWYGRAEMCIAFLSDVQSVDDLRNARWFTRGWTLQEMLAPREIKFYNANNEEIGSRDTLAPTITEVTGIRREYLENTTSIHRASIAERMSWAAQRETSRIEDMAYCLLGIFGVTMAFQYGEGREAFQRLQQAIIEKSDDETIFAWKSTEDEERGMLANWPTEFRESGNIRPIQLSNGRPPYHLTNKGLRISYPARSVTSLFMRWIRQSSFDGLWNRYPESLDFVLQCEDTISNKLVAIRLCADRRTGCWYRAPSSRLHLRNMEGGFGLLAVLYGGFEEIFVKKPERNEVTLLSMGGKHGLLSFQDLLLITVVQSFSCMLGIVNAFHCLPGTPPLHQPNPFLDWAYLTMGWKLLGPNFWYMMGTVAMGLVRGKPRVPHFLVAIGAPGCLGLFALAYARLSTRRASPSHGDDGKKDDGDAEEVQTAEE